MTDFENYPKTEMGAGGALTKHKVLDIRKAAAGEWGLAQFLFLF